MNTWLVASVWLGLALAAGIISIRTGISVAMVEILVGLLAGNFLHLQPNEWVNFLAGLGAIVLTFLAGAEVDPAVLKKNWKASLAIGMVSFSIPFLLVFVYCHYVTGWEITAALIAGIALSDTSIAIVYTVLLETGNSNSELGQIILAGCFFTGLGIVFTLGLAFAHFNYATIGLILAVIITSFLLPRITPTFQQVFGGKTSQAEVRYVLFFLLLLGGMASKAGSEAVLPAYILGLCLAEFLQQRRDLLLRLRAAAFAFLTPFYFLKAGACVSLPLMGKALPLIGLLLALKMIAKLSGVWPLTRQFDWGARSRMYATLLMSTGLTFGTIAAFFGLDRHLISPQQYSILVTVVILSGIIPTLIAQAFFYPKTKEKEAVSKVIPAKEEI
ncbi:cation:proton antiporter [Desulfothermobacter acidiphilus]|uniref:cation:proton antiporter n=1 Tax=Desulfothermobacter acidiphilus TaxID=1938353 RepID=UPI003F8C8BFB